MNKDNISALAVAIAVLALIVGVAIYFNSAGLNKAATGQLGNFVPSLQNSTIKLANGTTTQKITVAHIDESQFKKAPELSQIAGYINTNSITLADLKGKVVIVDFWTYTCINCIRTIPYLNSWYEKYAAMGLVIIGVHTPEFEFEKNTQNVKTAVQNFGIKYPIVQDNNMGTWNAYGNHYWPHKYLIDSQGFIRYDHIGEGGYADTEMVIRSLLAERAVLSGNIGANFNQTSITDPKNAQSVDFSRIYTPELYFGYDYSRMPLGSPEGFKPNAVVNYTSPDIRKIQPDRIYLQGSWKNSKDNMELQDDRGKILLAYSAKSVNIVAGGTGNASISEDGFSLNSKSYGGDLDPNGILTLNGQRLYNIVNHLDYGSHYLIIDISGKGFQSFTFTFG